MKKKKNQNRREKKGMEKNLPKTQPWRAVVRFLLIDPYVDCLYCGQYQGWDDKEEEEKNFCHAISLELHVFHHNLPKIPTGCYCEW